MSRWTDLISKGDRIAIAPSILSADFCRLGDEVRRAEAAGADLIHVDVMDGHFVPNLTIGPLVVRALRRATTLPLQAHLMMEGPERYIRAFAEAGADMITVHVETCPHLHRTLDAIREVGALPSVTLNPATPVASLQHVLDQVDLVLVMTVNPGFGGQKLIPFTLDKVRRLRDLASENGYGYAIEVDGGVNAATLDAVVGAGADVLVMGAAIFAAEDGVGVSVTRYRELVERARSVAGTTGTTGTQD